MTALSLLHGVGLDRHLWDRCVQPLGTRHRVSTPDLLGHGAAGFAPSGTTLAGLADDIAGGLSEPAHLVGFSLGALVAQQVTLDHPALVRSLVLVSSVADRGPRESAAVAERYALAERDYPAAVAGAIERWMPAGWQAAEPDLAARLRSTLLANDRDSYHTCYRIFASADRELWPRLPQISVPTLAITGELDPGSTPEMTRRLAAVIPQARAVVVPGIRHLVPLQAPELLVEHILTHTTEVDHGLTAPPALHRR